MRRDPISALWIAGGCLAGLIATGVLALLSPLAHYRDTATLQGFTLLDRGPVTRIAGEIAHLCDPVPYGLIGGALILLAAARRRWRMAALLPVILFGSAVTTQTLKPLLATPRVDEWLGAGQIGAAAWPSGHATAAMTLALCGVLAAPPRLRPAAAAVGGLLAIAVSYSILVLAWHFPSDVLGGFFVAGLWTSLGVATLLALDRRRRPEALFAGELDLTPVTAWPAVAAAGLLVVAALVVGPEAVSGYAGDHRTFVVGALAIAVLALTLAGGLARTLGRR